MKGTNDLKTYGKLKYKYYRTGLFGIAGLFKVFEKNICMAILFPPSKSRPVCVATILLIQKALDDM